MIFDNLQKFTEFQSTLPVWGATAFITDVTYINNISIHAPRVGSDNCHPVHDSGCNYFNPRSPCGERLGQIINDHRKGGGFQSTLPVWGATVDSLYTGVNYDISIHAPRVGSDDGL